MDWFFPMLLGAVFVIPVWQMIDLARYRWRGTRVMGKVIELEENSEGEGSLAYRPVIEYRVGTADNPRNAPLVTAREFFKWSIGVCIVGGLLISLVLRALIVRS